MQHQKRPLESVLCKGPIWGEDRDARHAPVVRRRVCATRCKIRIASSAATWSAPSIFWRAVAVTVLSIWSTPRPVGSTARVPECRSRCMSRPRTRCRCMRRASAPRSSWHTITQRCSSYRRRGCGSLPSTVPVAGPIWRCFCSLERSSKADQSKCSITDITRVISPMSRTLWKG